MGIDGEIVAPCGRKVAQFQGVIVRLLIMDFGWVSRTDQRLSLVWE